LLLSCFGLGIDYLFMAFAPSLGWLFIGRLVSGITAATFSTAGAYIADVTPPEKRAASFGLISAAWGIGFVVGPGIGGLLGAFSPRLPFIGAAVLSLLNVLYGLFVLPESLKTENRRPFSWKKANPVGSLNLLRSHPELAGLATVNTLYLLAHNVLPTICMLYVGYRYHWNSAARGFLLVATGIGSVIVQMLLVKRVVARLGERRTLLMGLLFGGCGFALYGLAPTAALFCMAIPVFALMGLYNPAAQALMTRLVGPGEQGRLQGANGALMALTSMLGPFLFTRTYAHFISPDQPWQLPGAPFLLAAALLAIAWLLAWNAAQKAAAISLPDSGANVAAMQGHGE
jgi:DHA1 family tetracycline resistance protein-like MFS transporter